MGLSRIPKPRELFIDTLYSEIETSNRVGVGAVFEWVAGTKENTGGFNDLGLEWLLRLLQDPKRLYKRYLIELYFVYSLLLGQVFFRR